MKRAPILALMAILSLVAMIFLWNHRGHRELRETDSTSNLQHSTLNAQLPAPLPQQPATHAANVGAATTPRPAASLPSHSPVAHVVGAKGDSSIRARVEALRTAGPSLTAGERAALHEFLRNKEQSTDVDLAQLRWLKNEVMTALRNQEPHDQVLTAVLVAIYRDRSQDIVVRDYSLQHLSLWYEHAENKEEIRKVMWEALGETTSTVAGTALLGLQRLAETHAEFDVHSIGQTALSMATDDGCGVASRLTAFQVCARMGENRALLAAMQLAETAQSVPLKISAVAAIGDLGGNEAIAFLERIANGEDTRVHPAAKAALKRLRSRLAVGEQAPSTIERKG